MRYIITLLLICGMHTGCIMLAEPEEELERGFVMCGEEICQPGTYCSTPSISSCHAGCLSNVNCLEEEVCLRENSSQSKGLCTPARPSRISSEPEPEPEPEPHTPCCRR